MCAFLYRDYVALVEKYGLQAKGSHGDTVEKNMTYATFNDEFILEENIKAGEES
jgi:hypothetical protein